MSQPFSQFPINVVRINGSPLSSSVFIVKKPNIQICGLRIVSNPSQHGIHFPILSNQIISNILFKNLVLENCNIGIYARSATYIDLTVDSNIFLNVELGLVSELSDSSRDFRLLNNSFNGNGSAFSRACAIVTETRVDTNVIKLLFKNNQVSNFAYGFLVICGGQLDSIKVENNSFRNIFVGCVSLYNNGSSRINSIKISENYFDSTNAGSGIDLDQSGPGIVKFKSITIYRNIIYSLNSYGIFIFQSGNGVERCRISDLQIRQNEIYCIYGIQLYSGGTGNFHGRISNLEIDSNVIMGANQFTGIEISVGGTGYAISRIFDFIIRRNVISNFGNGVIIENRGTGNRRNYIYNYSIEENTIQNCTFSGIKVSVGGPNAIESYIFNGKIIRNLISNCVQDGINISAGTSSFQPLIFQVFNHTIKENSIHDNGGHGIYVSNSNKVVTGISIRRNILYNNDSLGIKTFDYQNGYGNPVIPSPILDSIVFSGAQALLYGHLFAKPSSGYAIEVFSSAAPDPSGFGEGEKYLRMSSLLSDTTGYATFVIPLVNVSSLDYFSATATDTLINTTSPFSNTISAFTTSLNEVSDEGMLIYPNPANNLVYISLAKSSWIKQIELVDLTGQLISKIEVKEGDSILSFSTSDFPSGYYFLRALGEHVMVSKLIIHHD
ncbi:MAG: T9SS type A sorting domain-containing protein [Bacteroidetes bacterium]|nr:T9SS type A sorting domain-containing protein [Bacteroidota bacterium]